VIRAMSKSLTLNYSNAMSHPRINIAYQAGKVHFENVILLSPERCGGGEA